ncbi:MAG: hypothetical protein K6U87_14410 [Firmicutes bacterium]|nr:hypothetical protein [Bacillota bacterium]
MPLVPPHQSMSVRWSLSGLRQIIGQEIAWVAGDATWAHPTAGSLDDFRRLLETTRRWPRALVWEGPWLLFSEFPTLAHWVERRREAPDPVQAALREAAWYWRAFAFGRYAMQSAYAVLAFLEQEAWPPGWWQTMAGLPCLPVRDRLRLERRVRYVTAAVEAAAEGRVEARWGTGIIDCRPLLPARRERI